MREFLQTDVCYVIVHHQEEKYKEELCITG
jgi:hypothetical protein